MNKKRINAVVVTYNRPELLRRCIEAIGNQNSKVERIFIIDNCSSVPAQSLSFACDRPLTIIRTLQNVGGAGGFHIGLKLAMRDNPDAVWMMDDDGVPDKTCLSRLIVALEGHLQVANPLVIDEADSSKLAFGIRVKGKDINTADEARQFAEDDVIHGIANPFNGTLISLEAYKSIGDVKAECFIWGDETEYIQRARTKGLLIGTVASAIHRHPKMRSSLKKLYPFGQIKICPENRSHFFYRNFGYRLYKYDKPRFVFKLFVYYFYFRCFVSNREATKFWNYYWDGARNAYKLDPSRESISSIIYQTERAATLPESNEF